MESAPQAFSRPSLCSLGPTRTAAHRPDEAAGVHPRTPTAQESRHAHHVPPAPTTGRRTTPPRPVPQKRLGAGGGCAHRHRAGHAPGDLGAGGARARLAEQERHRLQPGELRHPRHLRGRRRHLDALVQRRQRRAVAPGRPGGQDRRLQGRPPVGGRLRQGLQDRALRGRRELAHRALHHRRQGRHRDRPAERRRPVRPADRHRARHPVRLLALGVPGVRRNGHRRRSHRGRMATSAPTSTSSTRRRRTSRARSTRSSRSRSRRSSARGATP